MTTRGEHTGTNHSAVIRKVNLRFYEELNDHLPKAWRKRKFVYEFKGRPAIRNVIQALDIPHGEVDLILVNGRSVGFDYHLAGGEEISVYPRFESFDISPVVRLRAEPLRESRFVVDVNLGKLARKLRLLGFDTLFRNDFEDDEIIAISLKETRIILTRDRGILKQNVVTHGYWIRNDDPKKQLREVIERLQLQYSFRPFSRCSNCNGELEAAEKENLGNVLSEDTMHYYQKFWKCVGCGKIYWEGSHLEHIARWVAKLEKG
ncbi:hypothetical protein SAMN05444274_10383 [Mariniphaga anaerophila]|uniref:Twitching motility protein PilT n=1 Tax=Mariniphaga anaerophila TaxID=1484053 RepID=A0A1M4XQ93_9BACT|nr:Mut7-C RNAse domain-containing protein [Mariniphaga anaerophila]SHE95669.1 hypothetical protein SAMN05444274_10383 [Mariniphaga anaerophila]